MEIAGSFKSSHRGEDLFLLNLSLGWLNFLPLLGEVAGSALRQVGPHNWNNTCITVLVVGRHTPPWVAPPKSPQSAKSRLSDWQGPVHIMARLADSILSLTCHPVWLEKRCCCSELAPSRFCLLASSELYNPGIEM
ncbi:hypothetical protein RHSIM_Rhsim03G0171700 [Rhododendron simsii]|uniref:Uncharacterized protein n=1 Tax=Rhododendron simsii TaxID=118357 RepID=A0A834LT45_RHOSS|nr:hypothetical protein RHSIM_Rhsim03G0171700 [Rhododendron simsii]